MDFVDLDISTLFYSFCNASFQVWSDDFNVSHTKYWVSISLSYF